MGVAEACEHSIERYAGFLDGDRPGGPLHGHSDKSKLWDGRSQELSVWLAAFATNPSSNALMTGMFFPPPGHQQVDIEQIFHGKSASISRTVSVVSGRAPAGEENIITPVCSQRSRRTRLGVLPPFRARLRTYSERVILFPLASVRIRRASSIVTLKVSVGMVLPYYHTVALSSRFFGPWIGSIAGPKGVSSNEERLVQAQPISDI
jgi:hypothetical protein